MISPSGLSTTLALTDRILLFLMNALLNTGSGKVMPEGELFIIWERQLAVGSWQLARTKRKISSPFALLLRWYFPLAICMFCFRIRRSTFCLQQSCPEAKIIYPALSILQKSH